MTSPDLKTWAQNHISALYTPESDDDLQSTFEATFSPSAQIFMGSDLMDREAMKDDLMKRRAAAVSATLDWDSIVVEAKDPQSPEDVRDLFRSGNYEVDQIYQGWYIQWLIYSPALHEVPYSCRACSAPHCNHCKGTARIISHLKTANALLILNRLTGLKGIRL